MAESSDLERTEAPTPRRRQQAREEGRIPRTPELAMAGTLLGAAFMIAVFGPSLANALRAELAEGLATSGRVSLDANAATALARAAGWSWLHAIAPFLAYFAVLSLFIGALQSRGVFTLKVAAPQMQRINPLSNARRMFGLQGVVEILKSTAKLVVVGIVVRVTLRSSWERLMALPQEPTIAVAPFIAGTAVRLLLAAGLSYLVLAAGDYLWQFWRLERELRMSKQELKQEMRELDGDPLLKQRLRNLGRAMSRRKMFRDIPTADVVITNPTHIAVALRYDPLECPAPIVVAMGQRKVAERIKQIARESGVPMIENKPLARALLAAAHVGAMIPAELYMAVAEVLAFVIRRRIVRGKPLERMA